MRVFGLSWLIVLWTSFCFAQSGLDSANYSIILIGDAGSAPSSNLRDQLMQVTRGSHVPSIAVFLGDNIYPKGLPDAGTKDRKESEQLILNQVSWASYFDRVYFIPGNHDWKNGHRDGLRYLKNQADFMDSLHLLNVYFLPRDGCPGPEEIHLSKDLLLVILDTQWFLHPWDKPEGAGSPCESKNSSDVTIHLDDILNRNQGKRIVVAGHHPVFSYGPHGGVFTWKDHLFPLTEVNKSLYVPLPIVGSLLPLYRSIFGDVQDMAHPLNKALHRGLQQVMEQYPGTVYASGHEHALQSIEHDSVHYIGSGAGSKSSDVKQKGYAQFVTSDQGFVRFLAKSDGSADVEYYTTAGKVYTSHLPRVKSFEPDKFQWLGSDTIQVAARASYQYEAGSFRKFLLGENYRKEWSLKVAVPPLDIRKERGGMKIENKGGGVETMTLRLRDTIGHTYSLRSVEKYPTRALPASFRKTFVQAVKQDRVSAEHPYGALLIPPLAAAAGIYHTNPRIVFAPNDPRWGVYRKDFAGQVMLFEERPDGAGTGMPFFGEPVNMISTHKLLEHMTKDNDVKIDQPWVLRSRLFDLWIGDWDRHDDQWRWGEFSHKKEKLYRPIPRDRDQAFFINEGLLPHKWRAKHKFPNLEGFNEHVRWTPGLMKVGRWFDRSFLNQLSEDDFVREARDLERRLTDRAIDSAMTAWSPDIYQLHGPELVARLKSRRSDLEKDAREYYSFLARQVDVVGSNKREWFEALWLPGGNLKLQMFNINKQGKQGRLLFDREFIAGQTRELRLYGLGGDDIFHFTGPAVSKETIRIIGGEGLDQVQNLSTGRARVYVYDNPQGVQLTGKKLHDKTSNDPLINEYDRMSFEYDRLAPRHTIAYNIDDGLFIGPGFTTVAHGFRRKPYKSFHLLQGSYAVKTQSFSFKYEGRFPQWVGKWDLELDAEIRSPNYVNNFFGWGNESVFDQAINQQPNIEVPTAIDYYRLRFKDIRAEAKFRRKIGSWGYIKIGPVYQRGEIVDPTGDRYIKEYNATLPQSILGIPKDFGGVTYSFGIDRRDNHNYTTRGIVFKQSSRIMQGLDAPGFTSHTTSFTLYQSFRLPARVTYVFNVGGGANTGTYQLYQAQALDGKTEIRGFRKTRFYGDSKVYFNNEVRVKLGSLRTYLFPASIGMHFFYDVGRVWYKDAAGIDPSAPGGRSDEWHRGYGAGLWLVPYDLTTIVAEVGHSREGTLFYLRLGFLF